MEADAPPMRAKHAKAGLERTARRPPPKVAGGSPKYE
jgi:hypothetical protein